MAVAKEVVWTQEKSTYTGDAVVAVQYKEMWRRLFQFMIDHGVVIVSSCDGLGNFGNNNSVNWLLVAGVVSTTKINPGGTASAHTWAVGYYLGRYVLFSLGTGTGTAPYGIVRVSDSRFTAGDATHDPTSPSSRSVIFLSATPAFCGQNAANRQFQLHGQYRADGLGLRLFICYAGYCGTVLIWDTPYDVRGVLLPAAVAFKSYSTSVCTLASFNNDNSWAATSLAVCEMCVVPAGGWSATIVKFQPREAQADDYYNGWLIEITSGPKKGEQKAITDYTGATNEAICGAFSGVLSATDEYHLCPRVRSTAMGNVYFEAPSSELGITPAIVSTEDDWDNAVTPSHVWSWDTIRIIGNATGQRWRRGRFRDLYWGPSAHATGKYYDTDAEKLWVLYGNFVVPNDGTECKTT